MCATAKQIMGWTLGLPQKAQNGSSNKLMRGALSKGGVEGWVQVELEEIYNSLPNTSWVQREQNIYINPLDKVDFLICCSDASYTCVELKVESLYQSSDAGRVTMPHTGWRVVEEDVEQLAQKRKPDYQAARAFVVAIVWSQEATDGMDNWLALRLLDFEREQMLVEHDGSAFRVTVYVITVTA